MSPRRGPPECNIRASDAAERIDLPVLVGWLKTDCDFFTGLSRGGLTYP